ncbi:Prolyl 3-hydroxylase 1 [Operophtera brumata]|uniref:Prolyl 3-hydroxylase 1 n=1 Tax=Operophtera brumata TaxID=104452 RepID=A0A0L7KV03_OPEBR|nr:Prolyl 3-hydroxylase 1 [Operophtera brumata]
MNKFFLTLLIIISSIVLSKCLKLSSLQKTYENGVKAYSGERWTECIKQFEESIHLHKLYRSVILNCRQKCNNQPFQSVLKENIGELKVYEHFFTKKDCLIKCEDSGFEDMRLHHDVGESVLYSMQARKPYEYLHLCYFQMNAMPKAASAAYTYLVLHPDDESMQNNVKYYVDQPEVDAREIVDLESDDYVVLYKNGVKAYNHQNWADTVVNMEEVLHDYMSSENNCRVECERQPEQEWSSEFAITMSNNIAALLHCQQQCQDQLKFLEYNSGIEFIADVLNYIQICYYKLERLDDAAKAVATYLYLLPDDEDMLENKKIYSSLVDTKSFSKRSDVEYYFIRDSYEKKLLKFFHQGNNHNVDSNSI